MLTALAISGCAALGATGPDPDTFDLAAPQVDGAEPVRGGVQILIAEPVALQALDSENIVIETDPLTIQYLGLAQWSDRLPRLVQSRLAAAFDSADRFDGVGLPGQGLAIDYQIVTDIRDFGVDVQTGVAVVRIAVKLLDDRNGVIVSDDVFEAQVPVSPSAGTRVFVSGLNAAFDRVASDIVVWVSRLI